MSKRNFVLVGVGANFSGWEPRQAALKAATAIAPVNKWIEFKLRERGHPKGNVYVYKGMKQTLSRKEREKKLKRSVVRDKQIKFVPKYKPRVKRLRIEQDARKVRLHTLKLIAARTAV